jgi:hypothetical protein
VKEHSDELSRYFLCSWAKAHQLKATTQVALLHLSSLGFSIWEKSILPEYNHYKLVEENKKVFDGESVFCVYRDRSQSASPRKITKSDSLRCDCMLRVSLGVQCQHETCLHKGNFFPQYWDPRWRIREKVQLSYNTDDFVQFTPIGYSTGMQ